MDLFSTINPPRRLKIGQANGEFLARLTSMSPGQRHTVHPKDFPEANPSLVIANRIFHGGKPIRQTEVTE